MTIAKIREILEDHISVAVPVGTEYANIRGLDTAAEKIEEAVKEASRADWSKACEALSEACLRARDAIPSDNRSRERLGLEKAASIARHLRRPEAAPARPSEEIVRLLREIEQPRVFRRKQL